MNATDIETIANALVLLALIGAGWDLCRRDKIRLGASKATPAAQPQEPAEPVTQIGRAS